MIRARRNFVILVGLIPALVWLFDGWLALFGRFMWPVDPTGQFILITPLWISIVDALVKLLGIVGGTIAFVLTTYFTWRRDRRETLDLLQRVRQDPHMSETVRPLLYDLEPHHAALSFDSKRAYDKGMKYLLAITVLSSCLAVSYFAITFIRVFMQGVLISTQGDGGYPWAALLVGILNGLVTPVCIVLILLLASLSLQRESHMRQIVQQLGRSQQRQSSERMDVPICHDN